MQGGMPGHPIEFRSQASNLELCQLLERLPAAAYTCDRNGLITYFNRHAVRLWGREPRLNHPEDRYCGSWKLYAPTGTPIPHEQCWLARALVEDREFHEQEIVIERPDGTRCTVLACASPLHDDTGNVSGGVNLLVDITDRKREEVPKDADRGKTEFLAVLAHELRNPLAPLRNGLQIIRLAYDDRAAVEEARMMMERQVAQMVRLIDELLDLSRIATGKIELRKERLDLGAAITDAVEASRPLMESSGHHFIISLPPQSIYVEGDRTRLAQVFTNLLNNSARYTLRGGHIRLAAEREGNEAVVSLKDNGIGIPPDRLPRIFDMFSSGDRTHEHAARGLGIGLSLVRALVELHNGRVTAHSDGCGEGSEFIVRLPVATSRLRASMNGDDDDEEEDLYGSPNYRILVVDDNIDSALSLTMMLTMMGHDTQTVHDGLSALETATTFRPDVILLDIGLPELSGYEVCRRIREQSWGKSTVIIAQTGWGQDEDRRKSKEMGFNYHLVKPIDPLTLGKLLAGLPLVV